MAYVPMVVCAAAGSTILPYVQLTSPEIATILFVVSFMIWSIGLVQIHLILPIYFWSLISSKLPLNQLLASGYLLLAPLGRSYPAVEGSAWLMRTDLNHVQAKAHTPSSKCSSTSQTTRGSSTTHGLSPYHHHCLRAPSVRLAELCTGSA